MRRERADGRAETSKTVSVMSTRLFCARDFTRQREGGGSARHDRSRQAETCALGSCGSAACLILALQNRSGERARIGHRKEGECSE